jgi:hypothetical protein
VGGYGLDSCGSGKGPMADSCGHGIKPSGSKQGGEFNDQLASHEGLCSTDLVNLLILFCCLQPYVSS